MKKVLLLTLCLFVLLAGCSPPVNEEVLEWVIVKSPITGRYYEVITRHEGYVGFMAMSEVTEEEYFGYLQLKLD